ncbi:hypothetical protein [Dysgonomonas sp. 520]|uniref:hypothetical protein n=1 Tax=Dysgonomonas sp. 520 TaxID=2302931 RepID=UPI0013D81E73|nr:hypothetical protein [Dysgonomonas sp. 520]NDW09187.1 hypothetical protein [Dysgonomonas sp. 520]
MNQKHFLFSFLFILISILCSAQTYAELKESIVDRKTELKKAFNDNKGNSEKQDSIIKVAEQYLLCISDSYFKAWYQTPWNFNGTTQIPKKGTIACGYFITTTLRDMGFNIPRVKWAQQTSEYMIKKMTSDIKRFHKRPMSEVVDYIKARGEGLYVVGLDCHVGYIYYWNNKMNFVHSNYYQPQIGVMSEPLVGRNPLNDSKYKVIGRIFDKKMIQNWFLDIAYSQ